MYTLYTELPQALPSQRVNFELLMGLEIYLVSVLYLMSMKR